MSVFMSLHFPSEESVEKILWSCRDHLMVEKDYVFMGHIIDMSPHRPDNENIPKCAFVNSRKLEFPDRVALKVADMRYAAIEESMYICKASEFNKIPDDATLSKKNKAILAYIQALEPDSWVIINLSC